jgi:putative glutamine amidotransferase
MSTAARYRPLIAVVAYHLAGDRVTRWPSGGYGVPAPYLDALRRADARTVIIAPGEVGDLETLLEPFDGLLLVGGGDVDPSRYGQRSVEQVYGVEADRDAFEIGLLLAADRMHVPTLCICRGMQVMNVAFGGTLHQHLPAIEGLIEHGVPADGVQRVHDVAPQRGTRLSAVTKSRTLVCSSHHHQGVDRVADGLSASGHSSDGLVEAIERLVDDPQDEFATWMVGVQWHPEDTSAADASQQALFDALALLARLRGTRARPGEPTGRSNPYEIVDHHEAWAERYRTEAARIGQALPSPLLVAIEHIGSTSVPGLAAKPVVDIQLALSSLVPRDAYVGPLAALGYRHVLDPWTDDHEFFSLDAEGGRAINLHVVLAGSDWDSRHVAFRDYLMTHPETAGAYETLKRTLAAEHPRDVHMYTWKKTQFIRAVEARAARTAAEAARG